MIIPFLDGFMTFSKAPITWLIILANVFLFSQNYGLSNDCQIQFEAWYQDDDFIFAQGQIYKQYTEKREIASIRDYNLLGRIAFRDNYFLEDAPKREWSGDPIAIQKWKNSIADFKVLRGYYPPLMLGVSEEQKDIFAFISYQFYHEGFLHLVGNALLVLLVGAYLERRHSGITVFVIYLLGGCAAAYMYSLSSSIGGSPLVGASGSLCALLGFLVVSEFKTKTRLMYILLPAKKYMGFVFVPTFYWVIWLCMIEDVSGWLAQSQILSSGVAHIVHIFGFMVGAGIGFIYLLLVQWNLITPRKNLGNLQTPVNLGI